MVGGDGGGTHVQSRATNQKRKQSKRTSLSRAHTAPEMHTHPQHTRHPVPHEDCRDCRVLGGAGWGEMGDLTKEWVLDTWQQCDQL